MASFSARHVYSFVQAEKLGGHSSFSTSSGPASCQVFLRWPPASLSAFQPIFSSPGVAQSLSLCMAFKDFSLVSAASWPLPTPFVLVLLHWSDSAMVTFLGRVGIFSYHLDEQPLPAIDGRSLLGTACSRWAEPETATVLPGKGFSTWKCSSTRNCRAGPRRVVASALCLIPDLGSALGTTLYMYSSSSRGLHVVVSKL